MTLKKVLISPRLASFILALFFEVISVANPARCDESHTKQINAIFSKWDRNDSPGLVIAVIKSGKIISKHAYGMANLEYHIRNTPDTIFNIGSVSKQFTAFAIYLLASEGKLSLDDNARKYIPELPSSDAAITIRNLLNHTSGIRDDMGLLILAGWRPEDVITDEDVRGMLYRQKELNFSPGAEYLYSNSDYVVLADIVARVSGMSFSEFCNNRIFRPLGMKHTHFQTDYTAVVSNLAQSYEKDDSGKYRYVAWSSSVAGPSNLLTTVGDLALWDQNFYTGKLGGLSMLADMQARGRLKSGKEIAYGAGFYNGRYRGLDNVSHSGIEAGYRAMYIRFPKQHFSVIALANAADVDMDALPLKVSDLFLAHDYSEPPPIGMSAISTPPIVKISPAQMDSFIGTFVLNPQFALTFTKEGAQLFAQATGEPRRPVFPTGKSSVSWREDDPVMPGAQFVLANPESDVTSDGVLRRFGHDIAAKRLAIAPLPPDTSQDYVGNFYSEELGVIYRIAQSNSGLTLSYPRGTMNLIRLGDDRYSGELPVAILQFERNADGRISGFTIHNARVRHLHFAKLPPMSDRS